jgi:putative sigma-54 modulation protein
MQIQVTFRHVEPSESVKEYAREKVGKIQKYLDGPIEASVTLGVEKHRHEVDVVIITNGFKIHGQETTGDFFSAIDLVMDKLEKQIKRYREKLKNFSRNNKKGVEVPIKIDVFEAESVADEQPLIIKTKRLTAKPMDVDEAAMQLDLSQNDFLVFLNSRTEVVNVIYRRADGNFGLIEPQ